MRLLSSSSSSFVLSLSFLATQHIWESKWEDKSFGEVDSSFGLQRSFSSSSSFKGLVSQGLKEVEETDELTCLVFFNPFPLSTDHQDRRALLLLCQQETKVSARPTTKIRALASFTMNGSQNSTLK
jgi:hypothetical protein